MISSAVSFKLLAAAAALGNVAIATAVLPAGQAVAFLAAISFAQLFQPFAGFGLVTRIVAIRDDEELLKVRHRHYFFLYAVIVAIASAFTSLGQGATWEIAVFAGLLALHAVESERVRAGYGNHSGIYVQNATVLLGSLSVLALGEFTVVPGVLIGLAYLGYLSKVPEAQSSRETTTKMTHTWADALKGLRAMSVTQFYSAIVVLAALIVAPEEALIVTLVYRAPGCSLTGSCSIGCGSVIRLRSISIPTRTLRPTNVSPGCRSLPSPVRPSVHCWSTSCRHYVIFSSDSIRLIFRTLRF